jgi:hypothetical protein
LNSTTAHLASHFWVVEQFVDGIGEQSVVPLVHKQPGHTVNHIVSKPSHIAGYNGNAAGSRF